jgi:hypothetical protein
MNAVILDRPTGRRFSSFASTKVVSLSAREAKQVEFSTILPEPDQLMPLELEELSEHWDMWACDTQPMERETVAATVAADDRGGILHHLQVYTGAALLGTVFCGLAFGWSEHREMIQWIGAAAAIVICGIVRRAQR